MSLKYCRFAILLLIFSACKSDKEEVEPMLFFENQSIVEAEGEDCARPENECTVVSVFYPVATGPEAVAEKMNNTIRGHVASLVSSEITPQTSSLEKLVENFISEYKQTSEDFPQEPAWNAYINGRIYSKTDSLVSVGFTSEIFKGGAHGYRGLTFLNFNPDDGTLYMKNDLFTSEFKAFAEEKFREEQGIPSEDNINSTGFMFEGDTFQLPANIGFEQQNILLVYNPYEIASYAAGNFILVIPREEVEPFLKLE